MEKDAKQIIIFGRMCDICSTGLVKYNINMCVFIISFPKTTRAGSRMYESRNRFVHNFRIKRNIINKK